MGMARFLGLGAALLGAVMFWGVARAQAPQAPEPRYRLVISSDLSKAFALKEVTYNIDDNPPVTKPFSEDNAVNSGGDVVLDEGAIAVGQHTANLSMVYVGTGYGVFSYLKGYSFTLKGAQAFSSDAGREVTIKGQAYEKGDVTTELKDKPALKMENAVKDLVREAAVQQQVKKEEMVQAAAKDTELKTADEAAEARLEALAARVAELGQRLDTSKARLGVLQDSALTGSTTAGKANLLYRNEMGSSFKLRELHIFLDGAAIRDEVDPTGDTLASREEVALYDGRILPGNHTLNVNAVYQGVGYGVFSYLNDFQFKIRSSHTFAVEQGKLTAVKVVAYESGDARTEIKDRPTVRFDSAVSVVPPAAAPAKP
jgi:hypothetical protein